MFVEVPHYVIRNLHEIMEQTHGELREKLNEFINLLAAVPEKPEDPYLADICRVTDEIRTLAKGL